MNPTEANSPDELLRSIANQVTHGYIDDRDGNPVESYDSLEARLAAGERLYITCGTVCTLAQRALARAGFRSRLVVTMTRQAYTNDNGHTMLEVYIGGRWVVYDVDLKRQPIDAQGRGMSVVELVRARPRRWRLISSDPIYSDPADAAWAENLELWYDRVLGVPLIQHGKKYLFHDLHERQRIEAYAPHFRWTGKRKWQKLTGEKLPGREG